MAVNGREVWALVCGAVRSPDEFIPTIAHLLDLRTEGLLDQIVVSTWFDEIDRNVGLRKALTNLGVGIVESTDATTPGMNHMWRQFRTLDQGVRYVPSGAWVFKARTDRTSMYINGMRAALSNLEDWSCRSPADAELALFRRRLIVSYISTSFPFLTKDVAFCGLREDLLKLGHFEHWTEITGVEAVWPECRWKAYPFLQRFPIFKEFAERHDLHDVSTALVKNGGRPIPLPLVALLGLYYRLVTANFSIANCRDPIPAPAFEECLSRQIENLTFIADHGWCYSIAMNENLIPSLLNNPAPQTQNHRRLIDAARAAPALLNLPGLTNNEHEEIDDYISDCLGKQPAVKIRARFTAPRGAVGAPAFENSLKAMNYGLTLGSPPPDVYEHEVAAVSRTLTEGRNFLYTAIDLVDQALTRGDLGRAMHWTICGSRTPEAEREVSFVISCLKVFAFSLGGIRLDGSKFNIVDFGINTPNAVYELLRVIREAEPDKFPAVLQELSIRLVSGPALPVVGRSEAIAGTIWYSFESQAIVPALRDLLIESLPAQLPYQSCIQATVLAHVAGWPDVAVAWRAKIDPDQCSPEARDLVVRIDAALNLSPTPAPSAGASISR